MISKLVTSSDLAKSFPIPPVENLFILLWLFLEIHVWLSLQESRRNSSLSLYFSIICSEKKLLLKAIFRLRQGRFFSSASFSYLWTGILTHFLIFPSSVDKHFPSDKKYSSRLKKVNIADIFRTKFRRFSSSVDVDAVSLFLSLSIIHPPTDTRDNSLNTMFMSVKLTNKRVIVFAL